MDNLMWPRTVHNENKYKKQEHRMKRISRSHEQSVNPKWNKKKVITKEKNNNIKLCMNTPWWQNKALTVLVFFFLQAVTQDTGQGAGSSDNNDKKPTEKHFRL